MAQPESPGGLSSVSRGRSEKWRANASIRQAPPTEMFDDVGCSGCRRFNRQIDIMRETARRFSPLEVDISSPDDKDPLF
jgi:hypothetical protein